MLTRTRRRAQSGQVIVMTSLVFLFVLFGMLAVVGDLLVMENAAAQARDAAFLGAQAGGQDIDLTSLENQDVPTTKNLALSPSATTTCEAAAKHADPNVNVVCTLSGGSVTASVNAKVSLPLQLMGSTAQVSARASGGPAVGTVVAQ